MTIQGHAILAVNHILLQMFGGMETVLDCDKAPTVWTTFRRRDIDGPVEFLRRLAEPARMANGRTALLPSFRTARSRCIRLLIFRLGIRGEPGLPFEL